MTRTIKFIKYAWYWLRQQQRRELNPRSFGFQIIEISFGVCSLLPSDKKIPQSSSNAQLLVANLHAWGSHTWMQSEWDHRRQTTHLPKLARLAGVTGKQELPTMVKSARSSGDTKGFIAPSRLLNDPPPLLILATVPEFLDAWFNSQGAGYETGMQSWSYLGLQTKMLTSGLRALWLTTRGKCTPLYRLL